MTLHDLTGQTIALRTRSGNVYSGTLTGHLEDADGHPIHVEFLNHERPPAVVVSWHAIEAIWPTATTTGPSEAMNTGRFAPTDD